MKPLLSIDIFDTALFRNVFHPTDVFSVIENKIGNDFKRNRLEAQHKVSIRDINYNLLNIYNVMPRKFNPKEEILTEIEGCKPNPYILNIYNSGKYDCIFISDMYLPSVVLVKMLEKCGYKNPRVFVSCEEKATKASGVLFKKVEEKIKRKIDKHIGDNYAADILGAQKAGIKEVEFVGPPIYSKKVKTPVLKNPKLRKLIIDKELSNSSIEEKIGYLFGPIILLFLKTLLLEVSTSQTVFFNARDSFILYVIARWILKTDKKIKYCRFSRKSTHLPNFNTNFAVNHSYNMSSLRFFRTLKAKTLREIIEKYRFDKNKDYVKVINEIRKGLRLPNFTLDTRIDFLPESGSIIEKFLIIEQEQLYSQSKQEKINLLKYINKLGMKNGDIFVDLGHFGSMQSIIRKLSGISLKGRYIHTYENVSERGCSLEKSSFLPRGLLRIYTGIVELIFSEPRGTSLFYTNEGVPICDSDIKFRKDITKKLLKGVVECVKDIQKNKIELFYDDCIIAFKRFLEEPSLEEASFGNQELFENGSNENESIVWYSKEWIKKGKFKECYNRSYWKTAFKVLAENDPEFKFLLREIR